MSLVSFSCLQIFWIFFFNSGIIRVYLQSGAQSKQEFPKQTRRRILAISRKKFNLVPIHCVLNKTLFPCFCFFVWLGNLGFVGQVGAWTWTLIFCSPIHNVMFLYLSRENGWCLVPSAKTLSWWPWGDQIPGPHIPVSPWSVTTSHFIIITLYTLSLEKWYQWL